MVTYRRELERKGWHRPWPLRLVLVVLAMFVGVIGSAAWSLEQEKGGWEGSDLGHFIVEDDRLTQRALVRNEDGEVLFEGASPEEVEAWIEGQRSRDFTGPILLYTASAVLFALGIGPSPRKPRSSDARRPVGVN